VKYHARSRRLFLCGAGSLLALPLLPSLLPRGARAAPEGKPLRYIQVLNPYGPTASLFFGSRTPDQQIEPHVNVQSLADIDGPISALVGTDFDPFRQKMSLLRGVDVLVETANHHYCFATCASSYASGVDNDNAPPVSGQPSVDTLIAQSDTVYDASTPALRRVVNLNPVTTCDYSRNRSFSWQITEDDLEMVQPVKETMAFFDAFATGFGAAQATDMREKALIQRVYADYQAVRDSSRISSADKVKLEGYMSLIADLESGIGSCTAPTTDEEVDIEATIDNQLRLLAAAMACDLTRVASITLGMSAPYGTRHSEHHAIYGMTSGGIVEDLKQTGRRVARLLSFLDAVETTDGTLLDESIVYWAMQYGCAVVDNQHNSKDMPVLIAGGANGLLNPGHYIDYRREDPDNDNPRGVAINNLLVTFMNCMGLSSSDYEATAGQGYGLYREGAFDDRPNGAFWESTEGRRSPLPFLYQGEQLG
jgi:hypothetical protein